MTTITIALPDERMEMLNEMSMKIGVTPEELLRANVEEWLDEQKTDMSQASDYVLHKNQELYRRLA
jgi:predicted DNA-binding protein